MSEQFSIWRELYRRRVLRTTAAYLIIAYVIGELVSGLTGYYDWPPVIAQATIWTLALGTIAVVVLSWLYDWTPWGIFKTPRHGELPPPKTGLIDYRIEAIIIFVLLACLGYAIGRTFDGLESSSAHDLGTDVENVQRDQR